MHRPVTRMGMEVAKGDQSSPDNLTTTYTGKANRQVLILDCQTRLPVLVPKSKDGSDGDFFLSSRSVPI